MKKLSLLLLSCCLFYTGVAQEAANALASRILGQQASHFRFVKQDAAHDYFTLQQQGSLIVITANNDNSMAVGLNYYLREYAHTHVSWHAGEPVELPEVLPKVPEPVTQLTRMPVRFFLNYCTYGYTMAWWQWPEWERFIDWMALNGVNMPLALTGQEAVWQEVWREMGMTDDEIRAYFSGPAHLPWHRMANLDGFGGPLPQSWIDGQKELQKKILARERQLNMTPVLPAFAGHVPKQLALRNPQADIKPLSSWCGFEPTYFMNSTDSLFGVIQRKYLEKQTALYGTNHIYGVDPFNEMDPPSWEPDYLASVSRNIYTSLQQVDADAQWLQMTWVFYYKRKQWTPERLRAYLTAVPEGKMLLLDYFCEKTEVWRQTEGFYGQPYIWCYLGNFGGNTMLVGDLHQLDAKLSQAYLDQGGNMVGVGSTLEGFDCSPQIFEFLLEHPWLPNQTNSRVGEFTRQWADLRYGKPCASQRQAWQLLVDSVYKDWSFYGLGTQMVARPSLSGHGTYYTKPFYSYDNATLLRAIRLMLKSPSSRQSYRYDVANLLSQWLGNHFMEVRDAYTDAYRAGNIEAMHHYRALAERMILDANSLLINIGSSSFYPWVSAARCWGSNESEKRYYETQARTLLTIWGGPVLNDYANRLWGGLLEQYYLRRWQLFFDEVENAVRQGTPFDEKAFDATLRKFETFWATGSYLKNRPQINASKLLQQAQYILRNIDQGVYKVPDRATQVMTEYMQRYPEAQLQDIYKTCYQDVYGPGHLIKDSASCAQYIVLEMQKMQDSTPVEAARTFPDYEYCGIEGNYVRVSLRVIMDGRVPLEQYVRLFLQSANSDTGTKMPSYDWRGLWSRLAVKAANVTPQPKNYLADRDALMAHLEGGGGAVHHSDRFNRHYNPHYRIFRRDLFEQFILPKL